MWNLFTNLRCKKLRIYILYRNYYLERENNGRLVKSHRLLTLYRVYSTNSNTMFLFDNCYAAWLNFQLVDTDGPNLIFVTGLLCEAVPPL